MHTDTRTPYLEIYPTPNVDEWKVRVRSVNGNTLMASKEYTQSNAYRFARSFNASVAQGRLVIRVLDHRHKLVRAIHPGDLKNGYAPVSERVL